MINSANNAMGDCSGVACMRISPQLQIMVASSVTSTWAIFDLHSLKKVFILKETEAVSNVEIIHTVSGEEGEKIIYAPVVGRSIVTVAVAMLATIRVYSVDIVSLKAVISCVMEPAASCLFNSVSFLVCPTKTSVNYSTKAVLEATKLGVQILACTDSGELIAWDGNLVILKSLKKLCEDKDHQGVAKIKSSPHAVVKSSWKKVALKDVQTVK